MDILTLEDLEKQVNNTTVLTPEKEANSTEEVEVEKKQTVSKSTVEDVKNTTSEPVSLVENQVEETTSETTNASASEEGEDDAAFIEWAKMVYESEGYEEPFSEEEFRKRYGSGENKKIDSKTLVAFNNDLVASRSKPQFASKEAEEFNNYILQGGDPKYIAKVIQEYNEYTDVTNEEIETNPYVTENIVWNYYLEKYPGKSEEFIQNKINTLKDKELLIEEAKEGIEFLRDHSAKKIEEHVAQENAKKKAEEERIASYWNDQQTRIKNASTLAGVNLDERTKENFLKWHFSNGLINAMKDPEKALEIAFITWMGGAKGLEKTVNSKVTNEFHNKLKKYQDQKTQTKNSEPVKANKEIDHIDMVLNSTTRYQKI
jgi:hypothetical protein